MAQAIKYAAEVRQVREVSLLGAADLGYWKQRLALEEVEPIEREGRAQVMMVAAELKWRGVRFHEMSFSILVRGRQWGEVQEGAYLLQAFNSCRFFAFCERVLFSTPYAHAPVAASAAFPPRVEIGCEGEVMFHAELKPDDSTALHQPKGSDEHAWIGPVFLPTKPDRRGGQRSRGRLFFARLIGQAFLYDFREDRDSLSIMPRGFNALRALVESRFAPRQWLIRPDAVHAKSRTYRRDPG